MICLAVMKIAIELQLAVIILRVYVITRIIILGYVFSFLKSVKCKQFEKSCHRHY